ncbi:CCR4-NOT transcription complex subunit 7/8 [Vigna unguiculata]|uniref:poly(A)-specific ribonuclease n=1 Tax=Vigna unguiculata TaxID=3917 RepID=A0A4D6NFB8_VIGUN|nr:CCR4-NOT transcription complex subunit 7/8 [Vigna unguiculata]QCE12377.1 CCR4-NOT transcription complex subunit 7/8 [Vigna unguiculata]
MTMSCDAVMTRSVWSYNLESEFKLIRRVIGFFPFISMDTEFPGVIFQSHPTLRQPQNNYAVMKANVDCMHLIQVGLTLSDYHGNLPTFGTSHRFIWEFNFCEFDVTCHPHAPHSIALLQRQGMDFQKNRNFGVNIVQFVELMMISGLLCNSHIRWITFHGAYDFAYMIKVLSHRFLHMQPLLPPNLGDFLQLVKFFFGQEVYDVKHLMRFCPNLHGGLDRVSESLGLDNSARKSHHAGSDSLVTLHVFNEIKKLYFHTQNDLKKHAGVVYGLEML